MKRSDFIRGVAGFLGLSALPSDIVKQYYRIYLLQSFVRGFRFYNGLKLLSQMSKGDMLQMVREPENQFDTSAISLHFNNHKIGYIPREDNAILSRLMDAAVIELQAEITHLQQEAMAWENVHIAVYVLKETDEPLPKFAQYVTVLETPHYSTLKLSADRVASVYFDETGDNEEIMDADRFYETMIANAKNDHIYTILHNDFESGPDLHEIINEGRMLVNQFRLPGDLKDDTLTRALSDGAITLNDIFDEAGYIVANVNRVASLSARIEKVVNAFDRSGRLFYEVRFL